MSTLGRWLRRPWLVAVVGVFLLSWLLSLAWWAILEPISAEARTTTLVIPQGTAAAVARGEDPPFIPNSLTIGRNGRVRVVNEDVVPHAVGAWTVPPGGAAVIEPAETGEGVSCTITPSGVMPVFIDRRPPITSTFWPALMLAIPGSVVAGGAAWGASRIGGDEPEDPDKKGRSAVDSGARTGEAANGAGRR